MRPIDADGLVHRLSGCAIKSRKLEDWDRVQFWHKAMAEVKSSSTIEPDMIRPIAYWILGQKEDGTYYLSCSHCQYEADKYYDFCPQCGYEISHPKDD